MMAKGKAVDRGKMWTETHKRKDGSYVTEAAREIGEKIEEIRSQRRESILEVSPSDALRIVLGPEHPGRVRRLGLGVVPTMAFKQTSRRFMHVNVSSSSSSNPTPKWQQEMTSMKSQLNALLSLYQRNIGNIPEEFAHLFPPPPQKLCKRNQQIRQNQIPHTGGAKSLARRRVEMMAKGKAVD
ncbi:uncharacterized protein LOC125877579 [Solanum stenotomum]|uniref:uncharacterized protein LOC125877579 n=1 Tax=Solanum stenotomum TaxID=172797 RepID=UPI0020D1053B|nr:uncharacterized protein LOC125877579 [Solanum stenotomum]